jgi:hypothetical protein
MNEHQTLLSLLRQLGAEQSFCLLFSVGCTVCLLISRIRRCFRHKEVNVTKDLALLITAPVTAILITIIRTITAVQSNMTEGIDTDYPLRYGLATATAYCTVALVCFLLGVISFMLPQKAKTK